MPRERFDWDRGIGFLVADIARLMTTQYNRQAKPIGLTRAQWRVIVHLHRSDGLTQSELAHLLTVSKVSVGGLIDRLEQSGWLERRANEEDGRSNRIFLTKKGRAVDGEMIAAGVRLEKRAVVDMDVAKRRQLESLLRGVRTNLLAMDSEDSSKDRCS
jgi:DNA-binding MarR family transcriptional regulator